MASLFDTETFSEKNKKFWNNTGGFFTRLWQGLKDNQTYIFLAIIAGLIGLYLYSQIKETPQFSAIQSSRFQVYSLEIPDNLNFAGEVVPIRDIDVYERFDKEFHLNTYWQSNTILLMKRANRWFPQVEPILEQHGLPLDFKYVMAVESMFENVTSPRGAAGFWQLMPAAAGEFGLEVNEEVDERYHPIKATHAACLYFKRTRRTFDNWTCALASYNVGVGGLSRVLKSQKMKSYYSILINQETSRYIFRVLALKTIMENPEKYGFNINPRHLYRIEPTREVKVTKTIPDLTDFAIAQGINYKILKQYNPWLRKNALTVREGKSYVILIPTNPVLHETSESPINFPDSLIGDTATMSQTSVNDSLVLDADGFAMPANEVENKNVEEATPEKSAPVVAEKPAAPREIKHTVRNGESLSEIAVKYNVSSESIMKTNNLSKKHHIRKGQVLKIMVQK
jgi:LysM repeat protein